MSGSAWQGDARSGDGQALLFDGIMAQGKVCQWPRPSWREVIREGARLFGRTELVGTRQGPETQ
jgi:hypothetical protein